MDQHKEEQQEKEEDHSKGSMDQRKEEEKEMDNAEEPMDENKEEKSSEELMDQHKVAAAPAAEEKEEEEEEEEERSSESEEAMAAWSVFAHPCSLLQYMVRACASWLWLPEFFCGTKPSASPPHAPADSPQEGEEDMKTSTTGFYMQEVITRSRVVLKVRRPAPPGNPREGSGGNGGHHH